MAAYIAGADPRRMTHCPACGSARFEPTESKTERVAWAVVNVATLNPPLPGQAVGKRCRDCGWQVA